MLLFLQGLRRLEAGADASRVSASSDSADAETYAGFARRGLRSVPCEARRMVPCEWALRGEACDGSASNADAGSSPAGSGIVDAETFAEGEPHYGDAGSSGERDRAATQCSGSCGARGIPRCGGRGDPDHSCN